MPDLQRQGFDLYQKVITHIIPPFDAIDIQPSRRSLCYSDMTLHKSIYLDLIKTIRLLILSSIRVADAPQKHAPVIAKLFVPFVAYDS